MSLPGERVKTLGSASGHWLMIASRWLLVIVRMRSANRTTREEIGWLDALGPEPTIVDVLSTLLAVLELAKRGVVRLAQPTPFSPMVIARDAARPVA